jgi:activator of HSP90 ATPase
MNDTLSMTAVLPASPAAIYRAWLDSETHALFTGGHAEIDPSPGGAYTAWDGYISGVTLELEPERRIVQAWRTTEFPDDAPDSRLELLFEPAEGGTLVTLIHTGIPLGQGEEYRQGWEDYYFKPMAEYFAR